MNKEPFSIVAIVNLNNKEALVLNRKINLVYERIGNAYIGRDGPFSNYLYYVKGEGRFVAFAGAELTLPMKDGTIQKVKNDWWGGTLNGHTNVATSSLVELDKYYLFTSRGIDPEELAKLRAAYTGNVFDYQDYRRIIYYDKDVRYWMDKAFKTENRCTALVKAVKAKHQELTTLKNSITPSLYP